MNTNVKSKVRYSKLIGCVLICFVVSTRWSETSIAATRYRGGGGGGKIPSTKSRGGWTEHGVLDDRTRCFDKRFDGLGDARARAVSMDAETRRRISRALPSSKNTHGRAAILLPMSSHACGRTAFTTRSAPFTRLLRLHVILVFTPSSPPLFPSTHSTPSSASQSTSTSSVSIRPVLSFLHHQIRRLGVVVHRAPLACREVLSRGGRAPPTSPHPPPD
jgi:hypothetical protein